MNNVQHNSGSRGFSLVELMIAMTLALVLVLGITTLFVDSMRNQNLTRQVVNANDTGQVVVNLLRSDIQRAGYRGCNTAEVAAAEDANSPLRDVSNGVALDNAGATSVLTVSYLKPFPGQELSQVTVESSSGVITLISGGNLPALAADTPLVVGNCTGLETVLTNAAVAADSSTFTAKTTIQNAYDKDGTGDPTFLYEVITRTYSLAVTGRGNNAIFLNQTNDPNLAEELAENIISPPDPAVPSPSAFSVTAQTTTPESYLIRFGTGDEIQRDFTAIATRRN